MVLASWETRYSTGINEIDVLRRHIVDLSNKIYVDFIMERSGSNFIEIIEELLGSACSLFPQEEALMRECCYADFDSHRAFHSQCIERLEEIQENCVRCNRKISFEMLAFLHHLVLNHIFEVDLKFAEFITCERIHRQIS